MKQNKIFIGILMLLFGQATFICINAKTLTTQEIAAINAKQKELQRDINLAIKETQKGQMLKLNKADQVKRDVELAKKITQYHLNKAKLVGRG